MKSFIFIFVVFGLLTAGASLRAQNTYLASPGDDLQQILDQICEQGEGGALLLEEGSYPLDRTLFLSCDNLTLQGAGMDRTELFWAGQDGPFWACPALEPNPTGVYPPMVAIGTKDGNDLIVDPCKLPDPFKLLEKVTIRDLTVRRDGPPEPGFVPEYGISTVWTDYATIQGVRTVGFFIGIDIQKSDNITVAHSDIQAPGGVCLGYNSPIIPEILAQKPHTLGGSIHHNRFDCFIGANIYNAIGTTVHHNQMMVSGVGVQVIGGKDFSFHHNAIFGDPIFGWNVAQIQDSSIHHNTQCGGISGIRYIGPNGAAAAYGWLDPSLGNLYHHNRHFGVGSNTLVVNPNFIGQNSEFKNTMGDGVNCPIPSE